MRRLCIYYRKRRNFIGHGQVEWIVCKECQKQLERWNLPLPRLSNRSTIKNLDEGIIDGNQE